MKLKHAWRHPGILLENIALILLVLVFLVWDWWLRTFAYREDKDEVPRIDQK